MTLHDILLAIKLAPISRAQFLLMIAVLLLNAILEFTFVICMALLLGDKDQFNHVAEISDIALVVGIVLSLLYRLFFQFYIINFAKSLSQSIGASIFENMFNSNITKTRKIGLDNWINLEIVKVNVLTYDLYVPLTNIFSAITSLALIVIGLKMTVGGSILYALLPVSLLYFAVSQATKNRINVNAEEISVANSRIIKIIRDTFNNLELIILSRTWENLLNKFNIYNNRLRSSQASNFMMYQLPRLTVEPFVYFFIIYIIFSGSVDQRILLITLVGISRMSGPLQLVVSSVATIRSASPSLRDILPLLAHLYPEKRISFSHPAKTSKFSISMSSSEFYFKDNKNTTLNALNMASGDWLKLTAASGIGKTTFIEGLLKFRPDCDVTTYVNNELVDMPQRKLRVTYVRQNSTLFEGTVEENIGIYGEFSNKILMNTLLDIVGLSEHELSNIHHFITDDGENISGGQMQRLVIARALYFLPDLLILDEATSALDQKSEDEILSKINEYFPGLSVIFISHRKNHSFHFTHEIELKRV